MGERPSRWEERCVRVAWEREHCQCSMQEAQAAITREDFEWAIADANEWRDLKIVLADLLTHVDFRRSYGK